MPDSPPPDLAEAAAEPKSRSEESLPPLTDEERRAHHDHEDDTLVTSGQSVSNKNEGLTPEAILLRQQLNEMSPLYLPRDFQFLPERFHEERFPKSYKQNNDSEVRLLIYSDNFKRQYAYLYKDRTRLFLSPNNECNVRKFVCTTIRPTKLPHQQLYDWNKIADFVADFLEV